MGNTHRHYVASCHCSHPYGSEHHLLRLAAGAWLILTVERYQLAQLTALSYMKNTWHENIREFNKKREAERVSRLACAQGEHEPFHTESIL